MSMAKAEPKDLIPILQKSLSQWAASAIDLMKILFIPLVLFTVPNAILQVQAGQFSRSGMPPNPADLMQTLGLSAGVMGAGLIYCYAAFVSMHYIADRLCNRVKPSLADYWRPTKTMLGLLGLGLLSMVLIVVGLIPIFIGLLLLLIPGIALAVLLFTGCTMAYPGYLIHPEKGIIGTLQEVFQLVIDNWLQVLLAGLLMFGLSLIISIPLLIVVFVMGLVMGVVGMTTGGAPEVTIIITAISSLLSQTIGQIGMTSLAYLFYGNLYLHLSGQSCGEAPVPSQQSPSVFGPQPVTSPLPPQQDAPPPPRNPGDNPWGGPGN